VTDPVTLALIGAGGVVAGASMDSLSAHPKQPKPPEESMDPSLQNYHQLLGRFICIVRSELT
jgi:hypothetical protein